MISENTLWNSLEKWDHEGKWPTGNWREPWCTVSVPPCYDFHSKLGFSHREHRTLPALCSAALVDLPNNCQGSSLVPRHGWGVGSAPPWRHPRLSMQTVTSAPDDMIMAPLWRDRAQGPCPYNWGHPDWHSLHRAWSQVQAGECSLVFSLRAGNGRAGSPAGEEFEAETVQDTGGLCLTLSVHTQRCSWTRLKLGKHAGSIVSQTSAAEHRQHGAKVRAKGRDPRRG